MGRVHFAFLLLGLFLASSSGLQAQPLNDGCGAAAPIVVGTTLIDTTGATTDGPTLTPVCTEESAAGGGMTQIFNDVWFRFVAPASGTFTVDTCGAGTTHPDTALALYELACPPTVRVACADEGPTPVCPGTTSLLGAELVGGVQYLLRVGAFANGQTGAIEINLTSATLPGNDDCVDQIPIMDGVTAYDSTLSSTDGTALDAGVCDMGPAGDEQIYRDLWYVYTATQSGLAQVSTCNITMFDTRLAIYSSLACPADPADVISCNDDGAGCADFSSATTFNTIVGTSYLVRVGGFVGTQAGPGSVEISYVPGLLNDDCSTRLPLVVGDNPFDSTLATTDGPAMASAAVCMSPGNPQIEVDVWFDFTAPQDGLVEITTCPDPGFDSQIAIYPDQACPVDPLSVIECNDDDAACPLDPLRSTVRFSTVMGTNYIVRVGGFNQYAGGPGVARVRYLPRPIENLDCLPSATSVALSWMLPSTGAYGDEVRVYENGTLAATLGNADTAFTFTPAGGGNLVYPLELCVVGVTGGVESPLVCCTLDCAAVNFLCIYDCAMDVVNLSWDPNPVVDTYDVFRNGSQIGIALPSSQTSLLDVDPTAGATGNISTYEVIANCNTGVSAASTCDSNVEDPVPAQDLILALERNGGTGNIDSALGLEAALQANGRTTAVLDTPWLDFACFQPLLDAAEIVWVQMGSFPSDYRLTEIEADALAAIQATGKPMYFESGDHWGFTHVPSMLNDRDGILEEPIPGTDDGDDTFTQMDGQGPLAANVDVNYGQDQALIDYNDQMVLDVTDSATPSVLWRNSDDTMTMEPDYITGVLATHPDGGRMLSVSFEFGGYALDIANPSASDADRAALAQQYIDLLVPSGEQFERGNCNNDASFNIADAVFLLSVAFPPPGMTPPIPDCLDACDGNDDGQINIADAVFLLSVAFPPPGMSPSFPEPVSCGVDPSMDALDCAVFDNCP